MELKGFAKVTLEAGAKRTLSVPLDQRAFAYFDSATHQWRTNRGDFDILLGSSSAHTPLKTRVTR